MLRRHAPVLVAVLALAFRPLLAAAQPAAPSDFRAEAVAHFEKGLALYDTDAWAAALAEFLEARRLYPLRNAGYQAALCLEKLQRYDEALDQVEGVLRDFGEKMPRADRETVQRKVLEMRTLVGTIDIDRAEAGAAVTIDGRSRGEYPQPAPLRVSTGSHVVRVFKQGFEPFEARVEVAGGRSARVEARLSPLARTGRLQIKEEGGKELDVVVDGNGVGKVPWEGLLSPGEHVVALRGEGDLGTVPMRVLVEEGRSVSLTLAAEALAASLRLEPVPLNANVAIDGVTVGRGVWDGRLRAGPHKVEIAAPGFLPSAEEVRIARGDRRDLRVELRRDPTSPFWPKPPRRPRFTLELGTAAALAPTFGGDVAGGCGAPCSASDGVGGEAVLHGGYELGVGLGFGVTAGVLTATQGITGWQTRVKPVGMSPDGGSAQDRIVLRGALVGGWAGWSFFERVPVHLRLGAGALLGSVYDARTFTGTASDGTSFRAGPVVETHASRFLYVAPEIRVGLPLNRHVELSLGLSVPILISASPPRWDASHEILAGNDRAGTFPNSALVGRVIALFAPGVGARYDF